MEEVAEELAQVGVVWLVVEPQRTAEVEVRGELGWCGGQGDRRCRREAHAPRVPPRRCPTQPRPGPKTGQDDVLATPKTVENLMEILSHRGTLGFPPLNIRGERGPL